MRVGTVYLVGAGPGDPGLLTVKGSECLKEADVVVYDRLSSPELLALAAPGADLVFMGKEPETPGGFQQQINESLVAAALQGKTVVRLKGGDPFVFGRGGEELDALREAGVPFEVVPGISSAIAVPAYAGIPVTHRGLSTSFTVVTGSEDPTKPEQVTNWEALAQVSGTLVVLMGWRSLPNIIDTLIANGKDAKTPVAVIQWGTTPRQRSVSGTLKDIVAKGNSAGLTSPVITVIGAVAALRQRMRWFDTGPLFGQRVLVTRSRQQASILSKFLSAEGADPIELPTIQIENLEDYAKLDAALDTLPNYEWVVFSSTNAIDAVFNRLKIAGRDARAFGKAKVCAIGPATARLLNKHGIVPDYIPSTYTTEAVVKGLTNSEIGGKRVLLPRASIATETLSEGLREAGAILDEVDAYRTSVPPNAADRARDLLGSGNIDAVTFTSSSTVMNLVSLLDGDISLLEDVTIVSIGPITSTTALGLGVHVDVEASEHTVAGIVDALVDAQSSHQMEVRTRQRGVKNE
jgi:uroporphyrinogen III methyltransferase/synthase